VTAEPAATMAPVVEAPRKDAPSGWRINDAMSAWQQARNRILTDDPDAEGDEAALLELLGPEQDDIESILNRLLRAAIHAQDMSEAAGKRAEEIKAREDRYMKRCVALRTAAYGVMDAMGRKKHELPDLTASVKAGSVSVFVINEDLIPDDCKRTIPERKEPDKTVIARRLKALRDWEEAKARAEQLGMDPESIPDAPSDVPGASLSNQMPTLQIRRK
jgi:hypothetical protein